jgi:hypothetical protein
LKTLDVSFLHLLDYTYVFFIRLAHLNLACTSCDVSIARYPNNHRVTQSCNMTSPSPQQIKDVAKGTCRLGNTCVCSLRLESPNPHPHSTAECGYVERREEASNTLFFRKNSDGEYPILVNIFYTTRAHEEP